jgi:MFS family permease
VIAMLNQATASGAVIMCYSVVAVPLEQTFAPSRSVLMLAMTALYLTTGLVHPLLGMAMDRYSLRKIMLAGACLLVAGFLAISFATSMIQVILIYALVMAVALSCTGPMAYSVHLSRWFVRRRARAMGMAALGVSIGGVILPLILQGLIDSLGWREALRAFAGILFVLTVPVIGLIAVDDPLARGLRPDGDAEPPADAAPDDGRHYGTTGAVLREMNFWAITIIIAAVMAGSTGFISNVVPFALAKGLTASQGAFAISCVAAGCFTSMALFAGFGDRLNLRVGLAASLLGFALCATVYLSTASFPFFAAGALVQGLSIGLLQPLWSVLVARVFGSANMGRVFGLMNLFLTPFTLLAPPILGRIYDMTGTYDYGFMLFIGLFLAALLLVPGIRVDAAQRAPSPAVS